jgi:RNA 3'-terminal phosphate cyclase (ATP)
VLELDGSRGEGGGQVLRTALSLALATRTPFRLANVRAGREKPGLRPQHLAALEAAAAVGDAVVEGAEVGSGLVTFTPRGLRGGDHAFDVGTAGSAVLVLQTVLPPLLVGTQRSRIVVQGGTHNPLAPPFEFLQKTYVPLIRRMGPRVKVTLERAGFAPAGGGEIRAEVKPAARLEPLVLEERGEIERLVARALVAKLPLHVAARELGVVRKRLGWPPSSLKVEVVPGSRGPGNVLLLEIRSQNVTEVVSSFGRPGLPAEAVADGAVAEALRYLGAGVAVGAHLADQLLLPLALAGGGSFTTLPLSGHAHTQIDLIRAFLPVAIRVEDAGPDRVRVSVARAGDAA